MTKMKTYTVYLLLVLTLVACSNYETISKAEFKKELDASNVNSAVSWWYDGEDKHNIYLIEKWPTKSNKYKISKNDLELIGINKHEFGSNKSLVNLKSTSILIK